MNLKKSSLGFLCSLLISFSAVAQHNELSFNIDPHILSPTKLEVNSPIIAEKSQFSAMGGVGFANFSASNLGIRIGLNLGIMKSEFACQKSEMEQFRQQRIIVRYFSQVLNM